MRRSASDVLNNDVKWQTDPRSWSRCKVVAKGPVGAVASRLFPVELCPVCVCVYVCGISGLIFIFCIRVRGRVLSTFGRQG